MASPRTIDFTAYDVSHIKLPGLSPIFDTAVSVPDGASVLSSMPAISPCGADGHYSTPDLTALVTGAGALAGKHVRYSIDLGANSGAEQRFLDGTFRAEDWNADAVDVASSSLAAQLTAAASQLALLLGYSGFQNAVVRAVTYSAAGRSGLHVRVYDSAAHATTDDGATGLLGEISMALTYDNLSRLTGLLGLKVS